MFGNNQTSTAWGQPQQNQLQPQPGTSTFGQPAANPAFGGTFGTGGTFGQPQPQQQQQQQQQQQPQANPMFGGQASTSTATPGNTGFGAFGQNNTTSTGTGLFGAPKPTTTGFGAFGGGGGTTGTTTFGGTGAFGGGAGTSTGTGLFGAQNNNNPGTFGGGGMFGQAKPATTAFGTTPTATTAANPNNGSYDGVAPVTTGSSNPQYSAFSEKDPVNSSTTLQYQSISCMPAYRGSSFEELRWQDYQQGRKTAGAFGQSTFGAPAAQPAAGTGLFGQSATPNPAQPATNLFGNYGNTTNTAGTSTTGAFGNFGQPTAGANPTTAGGGMFGGGGTFGQQQQPQQPQTTGFGTFGQPQQPQQPPQNPPAATGLFGGGTTFGQQSNQAKPFGAFGATNTAGATGGFGTFGQTNQTQPGTTGTGLFGQQQPQPQQQQNPGFGTFGQNNQQKPSIFGQQTQPAANTFGGFGNTNQAQPNQAGTQPTGGLFGNTGTTGGGLFGNTQQQPGQQQPAPGGLFGNQINQSTPGGLFGNNNNANTGGGLFGNAQPQQNATQPANGGFGLFGQKPATTTPAAGGGLFGGFGQQNTNTAGQTQQQPGGLFGQQQNQTAQPAQNSFNPFGKPITTPGIQTSTQQASGGFGGSLFGGGLSTSIGPAGQTAPQPPTLTASIAQPIGANLPIFSIFPPGPRAITLDQPKKKSGLFLDLPTRSPVPRLQLGYTPAASKLRGFTSTSTTPGQGFGMSLTNGRPGALSLSKAANQRSLLGPDAILNGSGSTPGLGSGGRQSVKKLTLDRKVHPSDFFRKNTQPKVTFNPALSIAARELDAAAATQRLEPSSKSAQKGKFSAEASNDSVAKDAEKEPEAELKEGSYYVQPTLKELKKRSFGELASTEGLVVGRVGYGEIQFLEPVDLTGLRRTTDLMGEVVRFDDKECSVYPELDEADKPPAGSGLNVAARISLVNCWALDKATRKPIKDESHPGAVRHLKRLKNMKGTHFESFDVGEGKWVFTVDHF
ncbi:hypothetical protein PHLGIDRAFT_28503 [Phlebiopsis gigantea 11061_1 CR5-6]|uniref:Peptidase S59 domain-containing protein n=1 Tax=Phlebiopsis gigantea (strain 11061_1 CR5-6) TaxID=745531 RepID=A0A0C3PSN8_PHLG1|nr:hypothetical protein PHLGIDRAFT_28503 [Phlebiopsis gigantea 11061_1 CR5-6]